MCLADEMRSRDPFDEFPVAEAQLVVLAYQSKMLGTEEEAQNNIDIIMLQCEAKNLVSEYKNNFQCPVFSRSLIRLDCHNRKMGFRVCSCTTHRNNW